MTKLKAIYKSHMILQREKKIAIKGLSDSRNISAKLVNSDSSTEYISSNTTYDNDEFTIFFDAMSAGGPYVLQILSDENVDIQLDDIYIGEVWLAGGQSNMELELQNAYEGKAAVERCGSDDIDKKIRFYYTPKIPYVGDELFEAEENSAWQSCEPANTPCWSAVGYYFAREIAKKINCMIGIIGCNWGGTSASSWNSREALLLDPETSDYIHRYDEATKGQDEASYLKELQEYYEFQKVFDEKVGEYYRTDPNANWDEAERRFGPNRYPGPMGPRNFTRPAGLYESMLSRVAPYTIRGAIFYQGEEDDNRPYTYKALLKNMIATWRRDFLDDKLPFINVQLPVFLDEGEYDKNNAPWLNWPFIREAQLELADEIEGYGVAVVLEKGEYHNIHPLDKKTVGKRLSLKALEIVYNMVDSAQADGPLPKSISFKDNAAVITIQPDKKICVVDKTGNHSSLMPELFEIASKDKKYYKADSVIINGNTIEVTSDKVNNPCYVRYFWCNYGEYFIVDENGIPMTPFRSSHNDDAKANWSRQGKIYNK